MPALLSLLIGLGIGMLVPTLAVGSPSTQTSLEEETACLDEAVNQATISITSKRDPWTIKIEGTTIPMNVTGTPEFVTTITQNNDTQYLHLSTPPREPVRCGNGDSVLMGIYTGEITIPASSSPQNLTIVHNGDIVASTLLR